MGGFGLWYDPHPWHFSPRRVVGPAEGLDVFELGRQGALIEGASTTVKIGSTPYQLAARQAEIFIDGYPIKTRPHPMCAARVWVCPVCGHDCYRLYRIGSAWMCRKCGRLEHLCRHQFRTVPGRARALWLRRRLGIEARLFAPLPRIPKHHRRRYALVKQIQLLESALVRHLASVNDTMERRLSRDN